MEVSLSRHGLLPGCGVGAAIEYGPSRCENWALGLPWFVALFPVALWSEILDGSSPAQRNIPFPFLLTEVQSLPGGTAVMPHLFYNWPPIIGSAGAVDSFD